ncbi:MAG: heme exporter protein CcmD [Acidiferrobacterales bacterium]
MNWSVFFAMGGYAVYVWSAYGFAALVLAWNLLSAVRKRKLAIRRLRELAVAGQRGNVAGPASALKEVRSK